MSNPFKFENKGAQSFLPDDYLAKKAERRTNTLSITLFAVVTAGLVGAFFVTNRQWNDVKRYQEAINVRYTQAAQEIEQLKVLEGQKQELHRKANVTMALVERVPRSILMAEIINRMPENTAWIELELTSKRITKEPASARKKDDKNKAKSLAGNKRTSKSENAVEEKPAEVIPPTFETHLALIGVAPTHEEVAYYVSRLQRCSLLLDVELKFSELIIINERGMNRFRIEAEINPNADAREMEVIEPGQLQAREEDSPGEEPSMNPKTPGGFLQGIRDRLTEVPIKEGE